MIAEGFVVNNATVYISGRNAEDGKQTAEELNHLGKGKAFYIQADFYKEEDIYRLVAELSKRETSRLHFISPLLFIPRRLM